MIDTSDRDQETIRYAGMLGHQFVVVCDSDRPVDRTGRCIRAECSTLKSARATARECVDENPSIYQRGKRKRWIKAR